MESVQKVLKQPEHFLFGKKITVELQKSGAQWLDANSQPLLNPSPYFVRPNLTKSDRIRSPTKTPIASNKPFYAHFSMVVSSKLESRHQDLSNMRFAVRRGPN